MSKQSDTLIAGKHSMQSNIDQTRELLCVFDENHSSYQIFAWHCCAISTELDQFLIILVKENNKDSSWFGTLTTTMKNKSLTWKNNLHHRQHQLRLSEQADSTLTHFEIQEVLISSITL